MRNVLVLPGSNWQIKLVKKIREMGNNVFVVNPYENSPCFPFATDYLKEDIFNIPQIIEFCKRKNIDAVISDECDIAMPVVARLAEELGCIALSSDMARLYTDKYLMREFCVENGIPCPEYKLCERVEDALKFFNSIKAPMVMKPLDSNASKGVFKVCNEQQIKDLFEQSLSFSRTKKCVLLERFISGTEFTIDGVKTPSKHFTLAISEKKHFEHNVNIASELFFTYDNDNFNYDELRKVNDLFVMKSSLEFGFTHAEYKYENGKFYLIEIAARGGGNMISSVIAPYLSGFDTYKYLIESSLNGAKDVDFSFPENNKKRAAILKFFKTPNGGGLVKEIKGLDVLDNDPRVYEYKLNFNCGDVIEDAISDSARIGFYIACAENQNELKLVVEKIEKNFEIVLEK